MKKRLLQQIIQGAIVFCCFSERNNEYYFQSWGLWLISHEAQGSLLWTDLTQIEDQKLTSTMYLLVEQCKTEMFLNLSNSIKHSILIRKCFRIGQTKSTFYRHDILLSKSWLFFITQLKSVVLVIYLVLHNSTRNMSTWIIDLVFQFVTLYLETFDIMNN